MHSATACVFSLDDAFVMPFQVFFYSLDATRSLPPDVPIFILHTTSLSTDSIIILQEFMQRYKRQAVFLDATHLVPESLPMHEDSHYSAATFYRLFAAEILPGHIEKAVYLDSDMLAIRSVEELFRWDVKGPIAAVDHMRPWHALRLWGEKCGTYFQGGVLVIPIAAWREQNFAQYFIDIMKKEWDRIDFVDQDVMNLAFPDQWNRLPVWFNIEETAITTLPIELIRDNIRLVHYSGNTKPWLFYNPSPFTAHWDEAYHAVFGEPFDRTIFLPPLPPLRRRLKDAVKSRLHGLLYGSN